MQTHASHLNQLASPATAQPPVTEAIDRLNGHLTELEMVHEQLAERLNPICYVGPVPCDPPKDCPAVPRHSQLVQAIDAATERVQRLVACTQAVLSTLEI